MYKNYIPPFRRQTSGDAPDAPAQSGDQPSSSDHHSDNRRGRGNRGGRGYDRGGYDRGDRGRGDRGRGGHEQGGRDRGGRDRGGHDRGGFRGDRDYRGGRGRGRGRGGRGGYSNNNFFNNRQQQQEGQELNVQDNEELYYLRDIANHFTGGDSNCSHSNSTFHDSKNNPDQLSYLLLFVGANPRWNSDRIVFAKSNLHQLPEFTAKKAEHGEWPAEAQSPDETSDDAAKEGEVSQPVIQDEDNTLDTAVPDSSVPEKGEEKPQEDAPDAVKDDAEPEPEQAAAPKSTFGSRMGFTDIRNLPPEELQRLEEKQKQQRLAQEQQYHQPQVPTFPPIQPIDYAPSEHPPVAAFEERRWQYGARLPRGSSRFAFAGWFRVSRVNVLAPRSAELVRMQQQKWERRDRHGNPVPTRARDAAAWNAVLRTEWAVVKFEKLGDGEDGTPAAPAIEKLPVPAQQKSEDERGGDVNTEAKDEPEPEAKGVGEELEKMTLHKGGKATNGDKEQELYAEVEVVGSEKKENMPPT
ncbi:hypothetical protein GGR53DRAFT_488834 [Hypoxylon sp. FL1150]|nr:hypothetical protein GGR53DRAFT_488834 [Hypoxylon sp. FL1150]